jgi:hypothetical protein
MQTISLVCEAFKFNRISLDKPSKALVLTWFAETEVSNVVAIRVVTIRLRKPPISIFEGFIDRREWENG